MKLKILPRRLDLDALAAIRATWPDLDLAADANGSLSGGDQDVMQRIEQLGLSYLEQPVHADDLDGAAEIAQAARHADRARRVDHVGGVRRGTAIRFGAADIINVKPARVGGPVEASRIVQTAADLGVPAFVGGMLETGIGRAGALAVAALTGCTLATDLGPSDHYFAADLTEPFVLGTDGSLAVPTDAGIGSRSPNAARLIGNAAARGAPCTWLDRLSIGMAGEPAWLVEHHEGSAARFHERALPDPVSRSVWWFAVNRPALVLGSAQPADVVDEAAVAQAGLDVVRRHSGGGAVLLVPGQVTWVDVIIPAHDPLWCDDVGRAFDWLGDVWAAALSTLGVEDPRPHRGPMRRTAWSDLVCFAGVGRGEVIVAGRKVLGISQRRTRCWRPVPVRRAPPLGSGGAGERAGA